MEYAVTDTEENLPGQMTFGMEESESGLEEFSDEETKAEDPAQTEEISVDEEITAETDADGFRAVEETDEVPFDEDDEISFDAEEEEETPEETAEEVLEDMAHEEDAEDEVKWAEKVVCRMPEVTRRSNGWYSVTKARTRKYRKLRRSFWIMKRKCKKQPENR